MTAHTNKKQQKQRKLHVRTPYSPMKAADRVTYQRQVQAAAEKSPACIGPVHDDLVSWKLSTDALAQIALDVDTQRKKLHESPLALKAAVHAYDMAAAKYANSVENAGAGSAQTIAALGMLVATAAAGTPAARPAAPLSLTSKDGAQAGMLDLHWKKSTGARSYLVQQSVDPATDASWQIVGGDTRTQHNLRGLAVGTRIHFRIAALGAAGQQSDWSRPLMVLVR